jgi:hypothetical protein
VHEPGRVERHTTVGPAKVVARDPPQLVIDEWNELIESTPIATGIGVIAFANDHPLPG